MNIEDLQGLTPKKMSGFSVYEIEETGSTNDDVLKLAEAGAPEGIVHSALNQTKGRGRNDRSWQSKPGQSLAVTLLIHPTQEEQGHLFRFTALAGLALANVLETKYGLEAQIKWPNDVLVGGAKICGILTEALWASDHVNAVAVGIGINLGKESHQTEEVLRFKATSLEEHIGKIVPGDEVLSALLEAIAALRPYMTSLDFITLWNEKLAFIGETVAIATKKGETEQFRLLGIQDNAALLVQDAQGHMRELYSSEIAPSSSSVAPEL